MPALLLLRLPNIRHQQAQTFKNEHKHTKTVIQQKTLQTAENPDQPKKLKWAIYVIKGIEQHEKIKCQLCDGAWIVEKDDLEKQKVCPYCGNSVQGKVEFETYD